MFRNFVIHRIADPQCHYLAERCGGALSVRDINYGSTIFTLWADGPLLVEGTGLDRSTVHIRTTCSAWNSSYVSRNERKKRSRSTPSPRLLQNRPPASSLSSLAVPAVITSIQRTLMVMGFIDIQQSLVSNVPLPHHVARITKGELYRYVPLLMTHDTDGSHKGERSWDQKPDQSY